MALLAGYGCYAKGGSGAVLEGLKAAWDMLVLVGPGFWPPFTGGICSGDHSQGTDHQVGGGQIGAAGDYHRHVDRRDHARWGHAFFSSRWRPFF